MATSEQLKILCVKLNISVSELARRCGTSPQAFSQKMKREGFTPAELKEVADAVGCKYESSFILPNGERVTEQSTSPLERSGGLFLCGGSGSFPDAQTSSAGILRAKERPGNNPGFLLREIHLLHCWPPLPILTDPPQGDSFMRPPPTLPPQIPAIYKRLFK